MRFSPVVLLCSLVLLAAPAGAFAAPGDPVLVSSPGALGAVPQQGIGDAGDVDQLKGRDGVDTSDDGRYTVFTSTADDLAAGDDNRYASVLRKDRVTGDVVLVSQSSAGAAADSYSFGATISDDGNLVAFSSRATNLAATDTDDSDDVYVRNVSAGTTTLISGAPADCDPGSSGDDCGRGMISGNGQYVAYSTLAAVVPADTNGKLDVYRLKADGTGAPILVTRTEAAAVAGNGDSWDPSIDDTGTHVAYTTRATNLAVPAVSDTNGGTDVYVRTVTTFDNQLVSGPNGSAVATLDASSREAHISGDGLSVAYATMGSDPDPAVADPGSTEDAYRRTLATNANVLLSRANGVNGVRGDAFSSRPVAISDDGQLALLRSDATNLGVGTSKGTRVTAIYARRLSGTTAVMSSTPDGAGQVVALAALSGDGTRAVMPSQVPLDGAQRDETEIYGRAATTPPGPVELLSRPPGTGSYAATDVGTSEGQYGAITRRLSSDGRYVVFGSDSDGLLGTGLGRPAAEIFRRDLLTGAVTLVSRAGGADGAPADDSSSAPSINADGNRVAFSSYAQNLGVADGGRHVYVRDLTTQETTLAGRADGAGGAPQDTSGSAEISGDGGRVAYVRREGGQQRAMVRDLAAGTTTQVDVASGGAPANGDASNVSIDGDGARVAFSSMAKNLDPADADGSTDVFVRDLAAGTTVLADRADGPAGAKATSPVYAMELSLSGDHVAFLSRDQALTPEAGGWTVNDNQLMVRDIDHQTTRLVSRAAAPANESVSDFSLDGTGDVVAFTSTATNLVGGAGGTDTAFVRRTSSGELAALAAWHAAAPGQQAAVQAPSLSAGGRCLHFEAQGTGPYAAVSPDYPNAYVQSLDGGPCPLPVADPPKHDPPKADPPRTDPPKSPAAAPTVRMLKLSHTTFTVSRTATATSAATRKKKAKKKTPAGTTIGFTLSVRAAVTITVEARSTGRVKGRSCVKATKRLARKKHCTRWVPAGTLKRASVKAGSVKIAFSGRIGKKALKPGAYRVTVVAAAGGKSSTPSRASFAIVRK